jgi:hypothetical protein
LFAGRTVLRISFVNYSLNLGKMERNSAELRRMERERIMVQEGTELWKQKKQDQWSQKIREQQQVRRQILIAY